jgi:hypothetical protein
VTAYAGATHGIGVISVPALGAVALRRRVREAVLRTLDGLLAEGGRDDGPRADDGERLARMRRRLLELAAPVGRAHVEDDQTVRFVAAVVRGNVRLLGGMVRANRPWRLVASLSRALAAALAAAAFAVVTADIWRLADGMSWPRLLGLAVAAVAGTAVTLVVAHGLWERTPRRAAREQVVLFNVATALTVAIGVLTLYLALLAVTVAAAAALIAPGVLEDALRHPIAVGDYLRLAWLVSSLATIGGALGTALETDLAVREAAYGSRSEEVP